MSRDRALAERSGYEGGVEESISGEHQRVPTSCTACGATLAVGAQYCAACGFPASPVGPGLVVPGFTLLDTIGQGGTSVVYLARQEDLDRLVAVKVLRRDVDDPKVWRDFQREARTIARLSGHPNVVTVYTAGRTAVGQPFLVTEYLDRGSLADVIESTGPLRPGSVADVGVAVADALAAAHGLGILHRDVKPGNVLLDHADHVKLADFGIARLVAAQSATTTGTFAFTPEHVAPEILRGDPEGPWSDVYGLASTLVSAFTGVPPFGPSAGQRVEALLVRKLAEPTPALAPTVPVRLAGALTRALAADPSTRPPLAALRAELAGSGTSAVSGRQTTAGRAPTDPTVVVPRDRTERLPRPMPASPPPPAVGSRAYGAAAPGPGPVVAVARRRQWRRVVPALAGALVAVALATLVTLALSRDDGDPTTAGADTTAGTQAPVTTTPPGATTTTPATTVPLATTAVPPNTTTAAPVTTVPLATTAVPPNTTVPPPSAATTAAPTTTVPADPPDGSNPIATDEAAAFVRTYYGEVEAGDYESAWDRLSVDYQRDGPGGYEDYVTYWDRNDVEVLGVEVTSSSDDRTVCRLTMRYHTPDRTAEEVDEATLVRDADGDIVILSFERVA